MASTTKPKSRIAASKPKKPAASAAKPASRKKSAAATSTGTKQTSSKPRGGKSAKSTKPIIKSKRAAPKFSADELFHLHREMLAIRRFEEKAGQLYGMGLIHGFCHLYIGQEAVVVGMMAAADRERDTVVTSYRDHGHMLACGMDPKGVMAELTGRRSGYSKGKGGSMHMFSRAKNFFGGHGIVGAQVPIGAGLGFAHKYKDDGGVCMVYYGDGAANQGQVHEAFNMAALWKLPVVFIIENNKYGMGTSVARASATTELYKRGEAFGIPGESVDGMNVLEVKQAGEKALAYARGGDGPTILGMQTYRYRGHSMSDPAKYRTREEVSKVRAENDPIDLAAKLLIASGHAKEEDLKKIDAEVKSIIAEAAEFAQQSPEPDPAELYTDVLKAA
jgi:pyruvate dehydrogenase E1 component alpha subunit